MKEKKSKKIKKGTNAGIQVLLCILAGGYFLFFTSKIWMPNNETLIEPTPLYARQVMDRHEVYLSQWAYSVKDRAMEVIIEIEAKDLVSEGIEFEAVDRTAGKLPIKAVTEHADYLVLRITDVPEKWKEISIRLWEKEQRKEQGKKMLRLYTNIEKVDKVAKLPEKEAIDYDIDRLKAQITYDEYRISEHQEKIDELTEENIKLEKRVKELETANYPSEEEAEKARKTVENAESKIVSNENTVNEKTKMIEELKNRSKELQKQIDQLKTEEQKKGSGKK